MQNSEKHAPRSWVGREVLLFRAGAPDTELVELTEVGELGLTYTYSTGEIQDVPIFVPWSAVGWMRPSIPHDHERQGTEDGEGRG